MTPLVSDYPTGSPQARIISTWSADDRLTCRIDPTVAHYTGQEEMAQAIQQGLAASDRGNVADATRMLGRAVQLAHQSDNAEMTLSKAPHQQKRSRAPDADAAH